MQGKDFLFLGYSLADWNVRVILRKLLKRSIARPVKAGRSLTAKTWVEQEVWQASNLKIYPMNILAFASDCRVIYEHCCRLRSRLLMSGSTRLKARTPSIFLAASAKAKSSPITSLLAPLRCSTDRAAWAKAPF